MTGSVALVFGGSGGLGSVVRDRLAEDGFRVLVTRRHRRPDDEDDVIEVDPGPDGLSGMGSLDTLPPLDAVVWAQGDNANDSVVDLDMTRHLEVLRANTLFVTATLHRLLEHERIAHGARLCVLSSVWQSIARQEKFSYTVSKAALGGLVRSAALDLAPRGILVNAVLPGVVDTPMTRAMLSAEQIAGFEVATGFGRLVTPDDVAAVVGFLCSPANGSVTGQSIAVDLGYSGGRIV